MADRASPLDRDAVQRVVRSVLYEGYVLYPYRASALKNQRRWMFGTLQPAADGEPSACRTECLLTGRGATRLEVRVRFLQPVARLDLVGEPGAADAVLSSPIILYDHPQISPESPGDLFDLTEIDEILTLRIQTLTPAERQDGRRLDARVRAVLDRAERLDTRARERLHGAVRGGQDAPGLR